LFEYGDDYTIKRVEVRLILVVLFSVVSLFASSLQTLNWKNGETFLTFLESNDLNSSIYYESHKDEQQLSEEIRAGVRFHILRDNDGKIEQVLIPIGDEVQLHIKKEKEGYSLSTVGLSYQVKQETLYLEIKNSIYQDIVDETDNISLAQEFMGAFKNSLDFKRSLRKGDRLVIMYDQKYRLGRRMNAPTLITAMIETSKKKNYIYRYENERYYDANGHEVEGFLLRKPVRNARLSSKFTYKRWHPILKKYRAHLGIDYAAPRGTPIIAAASGRVTFAGYTRGYGKLVKIRHNDGYLSLYAHQKKFRRGIKIGKWVKKGQVIGYVGSTGMSTGPHLHFGLYKNGRAINPAKVIKITTSKLKGKSKRQFNNMRLAYNKKIDLLLLQKQPPMVAETFKSVDYLRKALDKQG